MRSAPVITPISPSRSDRTMYSNVRSSPRRRMFTPVTSAVVLEGVEHGLIHARRDEQCAVPRARLRAEDLRRHQHRAGGLLQAAQRLPAIRLRAHALDVTLVEAVRRERQAEHARHPAAGVERQVGGLVHRLGRVVQQVREEVGRRQERGQPLQVVADVRRRRGPIVHPAGVGVAHQPEIEPIAAAGAVLDQEPREALLERREHLIEAGDVAEVAVVGTGAGQRSRVVHPRVVVPLDVIGTRLGDQLGQLLEHPLARVRVAEVEHRRFGPRRSARPARRGRSPASTTSRGPSPARRRSADRPARARPRRRTSCRGRGRDRPARAGRAGTSSCRRATCRGPRRSRRRRARRRPRTSRRRARTARPRPRRRRTSTPRSTPRRSSCPTRTTCCR